MRTACKRGCRGGGHDAECDASREASIRFQQNLGGLSMVAWDMVHKPQSSPVDRLKHAHPCTSRIQSSGFGMGQLSSIQAEADASKPSMPLSVKD